MGGRAVHPDELAVVRWLLDAAAVSDVSPETLAQLSELRVASACPCGCSSVEFIPEGRTLAKPLAEALAVWPDHVRAGVILWAKGGRITALEVYDQDLNASHRQLSVAVLRTYEQEGEHLRRT